MNRLVIIDGHAILHRAYHALPPLTSSTGAPVNAVYGFTMMLLRLLQDLKPTHLAVTFDRPKPTFRKELYKEYQAHRPKMDDDLVPQIAITHKLLEDMQIAIFEMDGFEADDVIGTIAEKVASSRQLAVGSNTEVIVVTGDRDLLQLVDKQTKVYMPVKGLSESKLFAQPEVVEKLGIKPSQVIDYKALVGDVSDNYPGVAGIGPKTAINLLEQFGSLVQLYQRIDEVKSDKVRTLLIEKKEDALLSQKLATVVRDVPISFDITTCVLPELDTPANCQSFEALRFRSLIPRLSAKEIIPIEKKVEKIKEQKTAEQTTLF